jgi:sigma-B regulation protein RsbU (phosphoserine phosphatase)
VSLRQKLFFLLAVIALVPLAALGVLDFRASQSLANQLAVQNSNQLVSEITAVLERKVQGNADYLNQQAELIGLALQLQAAAVERRLSEPPPNVPLYFAEQFDGPRNAWPPQTASARLGGAQQSIPVSYAVGSVALPQGVDRAAVRDDLERLAGTIGTLRSIADENPGLFFSQFTALEDGASNDFPGRGNYPRGYDPRQRSWYLGAKTSGKRVWSPPIYSASTKQLTFVTSMPVRYADGRFAGVSAIETAIPDLLRNLDERGDAPRNANVDLTAGLTSILVTPVARTRNGFPDALRVLAQRSYDRETSTWSLAPPAEIIAAGDDVRYGALVGDLVAGLSSAALLPYNGRESLWAVSPVPTLGVAVLIVMPYDGIIAAAEAGTAPVYAAANDQLRNSAVVALLMLAIVAVIGYYVSGLATKSIHELAQVAGRIGRGELDARAAVHGRDEISALANAFNAMVPQLQAGLRMQHGLELARAVQQNLLPLRPPQILGFDIAGASVYCDETGGDYYDFVDLSKPGDRRVELAIGDVSGHGIGAALLMASVRAALRGSIDGRDSLRNSVERANRLLCADVDDGSFMTLALLLIDASAGKIVWVNAAHDAPVVYHRDADVFLSTQGSDIPIGIDHHWIYAEHELDLPPGNFAIALGTDGIWETANAADVQYGRERFRELVRANATRPAAEICRTIMDDVAAYRGNAPIADDVTLVVIAFAVLPRALASTPGRETVLVAEERG